MTASHSAHGDGAAPAAVRIAIIAVDVQGTFADDFPGAGLPIPGAGATVELISKEA